MRNSIQIQAKKWSHTLGLVVIIYATIGTILSAKFQVNLMAYTTPIIVGFCGMTVVFAYTKRFLYKMLLQDGNILFFDKHEDDMSIVFGVYEPQNEPQNDIQETSKGGQETPQSGQETSNGRQEILNDTQNDSQSDTQNDTQKDIGYSYLDKYAALQRKVEEQNTKRKVLIMEAVREYVTYTVAPYLKKEEVLILLENINYMAIGQTNLYKGIRSDANNPLRSPDLRHLAWNIGERLGISNRERAIFIKASFPFELRDATVEYLEKNLRDVIPARIPIDKPAKGDYKFNTLKQSIAA